MRGFFRSTPATRANVLVPFALFSLAFACLSFSVRDASAAEVPNLVPNASLESAEGAHPTSWAPGRWGKNAAVFHYPVSGIDEGKAVEVEITQYASGDAKWYFSEAPVIGGATYVFSDQYQSSIESFVTVQYRLSNGTNAWVDIGTPGASAQWQMFQAEFTAPANATHLTVFHLIKSVGALRLDNAALHQQESSPGGSLIPNPSLEIASGSSPSSWASGRWGTNTAVFRYPVSGIDGAKAAEVELTQYATGDAKWYFSEIPIEGGATYAFSDHYQASVGTFVTVQYRLSNGTNAWVDIGAPAASASWQTLQKTFTVPINATHLTIFHLIKAVGTLRVDKYALAKQNTPPNFFTEGFVSIDFDDGWKTSYQNALPILEAADFKSTQYVITGRFSFPGYVNQSEVLDMFRRGHEIGAHTRTHPDLTALSDSERQAEISGSRQDLLNLGITPVSGFAYPFGAYNASSTPIVRQAGFLGARTSDGGFNDKSGNVWLLKRQAVEAGTTVAQVKAWLDQGRAQKLWLILVFHRVDASGESTAITPQLFQQIVDEIKTSAMPVRTASQGIQLMSL